MKETAEPGPPTTVLLIRRPRRTFLARRHALERAKQSRAIRRYLITMTFRVDVAPRAFNRMA
jgi:hypothetical protein